MAVGDSEAICVKLQLESKYKVGWNEIVSIVISHSAQGYADCTIQIIKINCGNLEKLKCIQYTSIIE